MAFRLQRHIRKVLGWKVKRMQLLLLRRWHTRRPRNQANKKGLHATYQTGTKGKTFKVET